jgi:hypothetical protein
MVGVFVFFASLQSSFSFVPYVKLVYIYIYYMVWAKTIL